MNHHIVASPNVVNPDWTPTLTLVLTASLHGNDKIIVLFELPALLSLILTTHAQRPHEIRIPPAVLKKTNRCSDFMEANR